MVSNLRHRTPPCLIVYHSGGGFHKRVGTLVQPIGRRKTVPGGSRPPFTRPPDVPYTSRGSVPLSPRRACANLAKRTPSAVPPRCTCASTRRVRADRSAYRGTGDAVRRAPGRG